MRTPPRAWVRAPAERGSKIPRGTLGGGCRRTPEGYINPTPYIGALQANAPLTVRQPLRCHAARLGRCIDVHRTMPSVIPQSASVPPDPTQLPAKSAFLVISIT